MTTKNTFEEQSVVYMEKLAGRKRNPVRQSTLDIYRSLLSNWILPELGRQPVGKVENGVLKALVGKMALAGRSASTIALATNCVKEVLASAIDLNGNELYPRKWNSEFIDAPVVDPKAQKSPIIALETLQEALQRTQMPFKPLYAILAGTGLRIREALAIRVNFTPSKTYWDKEQSKIVVETQLFKHEDRPTKTKSGVREIDICRRLNEYLKAQTFSQDFLFPFSLHAAYRNADFLGVPGFHSLRRFRATYLEHQNVPRGLMKFWLGHAGTDISDRYIKSGQEIETRKFWAEKVELGFQIEKLPDM